VNTAPGVEDVCDTWGRSSYELRPMWRKIGNKLSVKKKIGARNVPGCTLTGRACEVFCFFMRWRHSRGNPHNQSTWAFATNSSTASKSHTFHDEVESLAKALGKKNPDSFIFLHQNRASNTYDVKLYLLGHLSMYELRFMLGEIDKCHP